MPALDFKEIPEAHIGKSRDTFELFARDFLASEGFEIVEDPSRGPDLGRDIKVREVRHGTGGVTIITWLVSCKHKAHSGASVAHNEELNVRDRLETHNSQGFIAFYSTLPSSTLAGHLGGLLPRYELLKFDPEKIEQKLLDNPRGRAIAARYFPSSYQKWVVSSQYSGRSLPQPDQIQDRFFLREPHSDLVAAKVEASARSLPLFVVVYDDNHSTRSRINYCLGCFMEWESTKRIVDEHFVVAIGASSDANFGQLVPADDPLEEPRWIVLLEGKQIRSESVYANASEGRKRVNAVIAALRTLHV
jgi:hypothetical protein